MKFEYKMDKRGFANVNAMNDYMLKQWNSKVRNRDEVVILGDLSWGKSEETNQLLQKLNGRLYLIQGNHDHYVKDPNFDSSRFEWIKMYEELSDNKRKVILCHYPIMCYNGQYKLNAEGNPKPICCMDMYTIRRIRDCWKDFKESHLKQHF